MIYIFFICSVLVVLAVCFICYIVSTRSKQKKVRQYQAEKYYRLLCQHRELQLKYSQLKNDLLHIKGGK